MDDFEAGVVVIGSGPTGAVAARTLVEHGIPVTMLESGREPTGGLVLRAFGRNVLRRTKKPGSPTPYGAKGTPQPEWVHELAPGGLSNQWTCAIPRYAPQDFEDGARLDERYRWPVTYGDLSPHYDVIEQYLQPVAGLQSVDAVPRSLSRRVVQLPGPWRRVASHALRRGQGFIPMPLAEGPAWRLKSGGTPFNSFTDLVAPLRASPQFTLMTGAHALRLEQGASRTVTRIIFYDRDTQIERTIACKAVVLAAGTIATTQILLNSRSKDSPDGLGNDNGVVGSYLHDHSVDMAVMALNRPMPRFAQPGYLTRAPYSESEPLQAAGCVLGGRISPMDRLLTFTPVPARRFGVLIFGSIVPTPDNRVRVDDCQKDQFGQPRPEISMCYRPEVRETTGKALQRLVDVLDDAGLGPQVEWRLPELKPGESYHYAGTVRMHRSSQYGGTNEWGRLHSVRNVVIGDASVFTTCVEKNPTLTAMALARRSCIKLADDLKAGCL